MKYGNYSLLKLTMYTVLSRISERSMYVVEVNMFNVISEYTLLEYWHVEGCKHKCAPLKPSLSILLLCISSSSITCIDSESYV